jgi:riboflavin kinase / FMN adenylyltransferase
MRVVSLPDVEPGSGPRRVAIGTFDGVHLGHRAVIEGSDTVLTFDPHPLSVIRPEAKPRLISPFSIRRDLIASLGVSELVVIPFDGGFARQSAEEFVQRILIEQLGAQRVSVGENFTFGAGARGTAEFLRSHDEFETHVTPLVEAGGEMVSSSRIRALLTEGDVALAGRLLGGPYLFEGTVAHGDKRGRTLGMPTANLVPDERFVCPAHGVYAAWAELRDEGEPLPGGRVPAAVSVGVRPTFVTGRGLLVEAYLLDVDQDLYDRTLRLGVLERLRGELRFDSVDELVERMQGDVAETRAVWAREAPAGG